MPASGAINKPEAEIHLDVDQVRALLREQRPDLAERPIVEIASGWDNCVYRLGDAHAIRLPRRAVSASLIEHELRWLPELAPRLPIPVPTPIHAGRPGAGFPWPWAILPWLPGKPAIESPIQDPADAAERLGRFVGALGGPAPDGAPSNPYRGVPLIEREPALLERIERLGDALDTAAVLECWERSRAAPRWTGPPHWVHGDLHPANLLVDAGRLCAVIDFGDLAAGDPAVDLSVAWMLFGPEERARFRASIDDATRRDDDIWLRARGNALAHAVAVRANSADVPAMTAMAERTLQSILDDSYDTGR